MTVISVGNVKKSFVFFGSMILRGRVVLKNVNHLAAVLHDFLKRNAPAQMGVAKCHVFP